MFTFGGLATNKAGQVLDAAGDPIGGLYAAGECTGVYHGKYPGGTSVLRGMISRQTRWSCCRAASFTDHRPRLTTVPFARTQYRQEPVMAASSLPAPTPLPDTGSQYESPNTAVGPNPASRFRTLLGAGVGNTLEWYDWSVYAIFAPFFAHQFFVSDDPASALLSTLAVFAAGFLMRPIGGFVFGWLADKYGRRLSLSTSMIHHGSRQPAHRCSPYPRRHRRVGRADPVGGQAHPGPRSWR